MFFNRFDNFNFLETSESWLSKSAKFHLNRIVTIQYEYIVTILFIFHKTIFTTVNIQETNLI